MDLAGQQQRIQRHPEIVDDDILDDFDDAGGGIDLHLGEVGAVGIGAVGAGKGRGGLQLRRIDARPLRQIGEAYGAVGAGNPHDAIADLEVADAGFQRLGGDLLQIRPQCAGGALDADAAGRDRSRAAGAEAGGDAVGVALEDVDTFRREAELLGYDLRIGGLVALPARLRADQDADVAIGVERHIGGLLAHGAAHLDIGAEPDAAHQPVFLRGLGAPGKLLPVADFHRPLHMRGEVAGVIHLAGRGLVRHRARRNEVLAPDRIRRHAEFSRGGIDQPLDHVSRLGTSGATIGVHRHGVGEHGADAAVKRLNVVEARQHAGAAMRNVGREGRQIRAHVAHQIDVHAQELAVLGQRHPRRGDVVAALRVAHEMIGAVGGPFDRAAQPARGDRDQRIFAIGKQLGAESAADIRADHPHLFERDFQDHSGNDLAQPMAALAADRQRQMIALGVVFTDRRPRLHEIGNDPAD